MEENASQRPEGWTPPSNNDDEAGKAGMEYCLMARDNEKSCDDWEKIRDGEEEPDYACDKNPRTNNHDEEYYNRINGVNPDDNWLVNCTHCGTYVFPNDVCFACRGPGVAKKEEEWKPNTFGWCEKSARTGNVGYHCIHCIKDTNTGLFPEVKSSKPGEEYEEKNPSASEQGKEKKGTKSNRSSDDEAEFVFIHKSSLEDNEQQDNKDGFTLVKNINEDIPEEKYDDITVKTNNIGPI